MKKFLLATMFLPISVAAQPTVEVNMDVLDKFRSTSAPAKTSAPAAPEEFEIAMRPPAPRYEAPAGYPAPPQTVVAPEAPVSDDEGNGLGIDGEFSGNVGLTSDYIYRGVSQGREAPAIQGGLDYSHPTGAYIGLWASSVDFGNSQASAEIDYYAGYTTEIAEGVSVDGGVLYYNYPSADSNLNYDFVEVYGGVGYETELAGHEISTNTTLNYSPDFFAGSGSSYYLKGAASTPLPYGITIDGHIARQWIEDNAAAALPDYNDWSIGLAYAIEDFELKAQYIDTDIDTGACADGCDAKGVLSVSRSL